MYRSPRYVRDGNSSAFSSGSFAKHMVMSRDQNAGQIHSVRIDNSTFERVEEFKYLGTILKN